MFSQRVSGSFPSFEGEVQHASLVVNSRRRRMPGKVRVTLARHAGDEKKGFAKESEPFLCFRSFYFFATSNERIAVSTRGRACASVSPAKAGEETTSSDRIPFGATGRT